MKNKLLIFACALVICTTVLLLNIADMPEFQRNEFASGETASFISDKKGKININTASAEELTALYGIGEVNAEKIIEYRKYNGKIIAAEELEAIDGIGHSVIERNRDIITF